MEDYKEAALRHLEDSETLFAKQAFDNAGHLAGFAAECAIKYKIQITGVGGDNPKLHFPAIIMAAKKRLTGRNNGRIHQLLSRANPLLNGWDVNSRYFHNGSISSDLAGEWIQDTKRLFATAGIKMRVKK